MQSLNILQAEIAGYRISGQIGSGGMGMVYKAYHAGLNRHAAIKVLFQKELAERFKNEANIQASISHPNIARLYAFASFEGMPCLIMEYVDGVSLDAYIRQKGRLENEEAERILEQIAGALDYLHKREIIHRDIKPQNFKIKANGTVKMLDFGITKNSFTPQLTHHGFVVGTREYMAPEQLRGQVCARSDIWSLGVMVYEMVTGFLPFESIDPMAYFPKSAKGTFTDPRILVPQVSEKLCVIIKRSLKIQPRSRISAIEIQAILNQRRGAHRKKLMKPLFRSEGKKWFYAAGVFLLAVVLVFSSQVKRGEHGGPEPPEDLEKTEILVSGAINAFILFPDGRRHPVPYDLYGAEGETVEFVLQAEGYKNKAVKFAVSPRRKSYQYSLERINE